MNSKDIQKYIVGLNNKFHIEVYPELASTNLFLSSKAQVLNKDAVVIVADHQTAGVGRQGKQWLSTPGNISFSVLTHFDLPPGKLMGLSLVTGLSVARVLRDLIDLDCYLKWPNDIYVDDSKLAGLLIEVVNCSSNKSSVITGIGLNYKAMKVSEYDQPVIGLEDLRAELPSRSQLIGCILTALINNYGKYHNKGLVEFLPQWRKADYLYGREVKIIQQQKEVFGIAQGLSELGELLVDVDGHIIRYNSGDVSIRRL